MMVLCLSPSNEKKLNALAKAKGLTPEKAIRYALEETLERLELETQAQQFSKAGQALSNAEAEQIAVEAVQAIRKGHKMTHPVTPEFGQPPLLTLSSNKAIHLLALRLRSSAN
jgi:hypothetical protein